MPTDCSNGVGWLAKLTPSRTGVCGAPVDGAQLAHTLGSKAVDKRHLLALVGPAPGCSNEQEGASTSTRTSTCSSPTGRGTRRADGTLRFETTPAPALAEVAALADRIARRLTKMLHRRGLTVREGAEAPPPSHQIRWPAASRLRSGSAIASGKAPP